MPIPSFDPETGALPPGDHLATLEEVNRAFGWTFRRRELLRELGHVIEFLRDKGVLRIWIDGSFVTDKDRPNDVDVLYEAPPDVDARTWGIHSPRRRRDLKELTRIDLWKAPAPQPVSDRPGKTQSLHDFWSTDREGRETGFILLEVRDDP